MLYQKTHRSIYTYQYHNHKSLVRNNLSLFHFHILLEDPHLRGILLGHKYYHDNPYHINNLQSSRHPRGHHRYVQPCLPVYAQGSIHHDSYSSVDMLDVGKRYHRTQRNTHTYQFYDHKYLYSSILPMGEGHLPLLHSQPKRNPLDMCVENNRHQSTQAHHQSQHSIYNCYSWCSRHVRNKHEDTYLLCACVFSCQTHPVPRAL